MLKLPSLKDVTELKGKKVLLRVSVNAPIRDGVVTSQFRLLRILPTINYLREQGAKTVIIGHIGRDKTDSLKPIYEAMSEMVEMEWCGGLLGTDVTARVEALEDGEILMLENLRQDEREVVNDADFTKELAQLADLYVNEDFAASHREHSSIVGLPKLLPAYFGFNFLSEVKELEGAIDPESPSVFILGGAKFQTKLPLVDMYANKYSQVFIGGALANDIFKAKGFEIGKSLVSDIDLRDHSILNHLNIMVPTDVTVQGDNGVRVTSPEQVQSTEKIVDAGPETIKAWAEYLKTAKTILWNGPLGIYEAGFNKETESLTKEIAKVSGHSIVGAGDTIASIEALCLQDGFDFLSTGGGAMLDFLENGTLPAIEAVVSKQ